MKIFSIDPCRMFVTLMATILAIFITTPGRTQDKSTGSEKSGTTIHLKVVKDKDGKTTTLDTTINFSSPVDREEIREMIHKLKNDMKEMKLDIKNLGYDMQLELEGIDGMDSLEKEMDQVIVLKNRGKGGDIRIHKGPRGYNYNYQFRCPELQDLSEWECPGDAAFDISIPRPDRRIMDLRRDEGGSLNDLLGDIPMDRVKSYSIKDRKNGKRIVIDLEDGPWPVVRDHVVVIGGDRQRVQQRHTTGEKNVRVIVTPKHDQEEFEKQEGKAPEVIPENPTKNERQESGSSEETPKI